MTLTLDPRLENDSHVLFHWNDVSFLLHKNASIPWLILVPKTDKMELLDLPEPLKGRVLIYSQVAQSVLKQFYHAEKINFAAIGNVVSQLHIHVVGRHSKDPCWPDVVWGASYPNKEYTDEQISELKIQLLNQLENHDSTR